MIAALDERDQAIFERRRQLLDAVEGPRVGDFVCFADGTERRISYIWFGEHVQTSDGGSWYLGDGYTNFSGSLCSPVPIESLRETGELRSGQVWFFHHNWWQAHNGVHAELLFRVYECDREAPR